MLSSMYFLAVLAMMSLAWATQFYLTDQIAAYTLLIFGTSGFIIAQVLKRKVHTLAEDYLVIVVCTYVFSWVVLKPDLGLSHWWLVLILLVSMSWFYYLKYVERLKQRLKDLQDNYEKDK